MILNIYYNILYHRMLCSVVVCSIPGVPRGSREQQLQQPLGACRGPGERLGLRLCGPMSQLLRGCGLCTQPGCAHIKSLLTSKILYI